MGGLLPTAIVDEPQHLHPVLIGTFNLRLSHQRT